MVVIVPIALRSMSELVAGSQPTNASPEPFIHLANRIVVTDHPPRQ